MIREYTTTENETVTEEMLQEIEEAKKHPIVFDEDCPELSPAMMKAFRCAVVHRNRKLGTG